LTIDNGIGEFLKNDGVSISININKLL